MKACVFYNVFSLLTVFLAHLRGRRSRLGMTWGLAASAACPSDVANPGEQGPDWGWPVLGQAPPPFRSSTAIQAVRGQPVSRPSSMYDCVWAQLSGCFRKVNCTHGGKTINRRLVVVQSASPKTISTEKRERACCMSHNQSASPEFVYVNYSHGLLNRLTSADTVSG